MPRKSLYSSINNLSYKSLLIILFFLLISIVVLWKFVLSNHKVEASWWNDGWNYRKAISISNTSGSNLTDFQISLSIGTSALIASGKMQSDCDDIRITDINGNLLPYWIEENNPGCNQITDTKIWVKASSIPTSGSIVYLYYGNSSAPSAQSGNNVFDFFDDFNETTLKNNWKQDSGSWQIGTTGGQSCVTITPATSNNYLRSINYSTSNSYIIELQTLSQLSGTAQAHPGVIFNATSGFNDQFYLRPHQQTNGIQYGYYNGSLITSTAFDSIYTWSTWMNTKVSVSGDVAKIYQNNILKGTLTGLNYDGIYSNVGLASHSFSINYYNYFFVRKYASADPTSTLQSEETGGGPVAYWKFDEGSGTTAYDSTTNQNNGTISGATWQTEDQCISGKCLKFDGSNDYINNPNSINNLNSMTIQLWFKTPNINAGGQYLLDGRNGGNWWFLQDYASGACTDSNGNICFNGLVEIPSSYLSNNKWYHITLTTDSSSSKIYLNGKLINTGAAFTPSIGANLRIGTRYTTQSFFNGFIDEPKIYPYARTADQIKKDYNSRGSSKGTSANLGGAASDNNLSDGLVGYWKFDEGSGTTANNSGNGGSTLNGTFGAGSSAPIWSSDGKFGKSLNFDGVNDYITVPFQNFITKNGTYTFSTWIYLKGSGQNTIFQNSLNDTDRNGLATTGGNNIQFGYYDGSWHGKSGSISLNNWTHIVGVNNSGTLKLYINGIEQSGNNSPYIYSTNNYLYLGKTSLIGQEYPFNGLIDEVKIYNYALNSEEVKQDYNKGSAIQMGQTSQTISGTTTNLEYCIPGDTSPCASPVAEWNFEENTGTTTKDSSGNNNTGTFGTGNSAPTWTIGKKNTGAGLKFDGVNDYITVPNYFNLSPATLEFWFKANSWSNNPVVIGKDSAGPNNGYIQSTGTLKFYAPGNIATVNWGTPSLNTWHHATLVITGSQHLAYLDGLAVGSTVSSSLALFTGNYNFKIGCYDGGTYDFNGSIDGVKIYNYARTPAQVAYDYNKGGPIGWWKLDECQGSVANDSSGIGNTGSINIGGAGTQTSLGTCTTSGTAWGNGASGKINSSLNFDGVDDYVQINDNSAIKPTNNITLSAWVKPISPGSGLQMIMDKQTSSGTFGYVLRIENSTARPFLRLSGTTNGELYGVTAITANQWTHLTAVYDGTASKIYINGKLDSSQATSGTITYDSTPLAIGKRGGGNEYYFNGKIDDVRIYNYALTPEQIKTLYNGGAVSFN